MDQDLIKTCRLCLTKSSDLMNIFLETAVDGNIISFTQIVEYSIDILVNNDDNLPKHVCAECHNKVTDIYLFKAKAKRSEQSLKRVLEPGDPSENSNHTQNVLMGPVENLVGDERSPREPFEILMEVQTCPSADTDNESGREESEMFEQPNSSSPQANSTEKPSVQKRYSCPICGMLFLRSFTLNIHLRYHEGKLPYECPICFKGFAQAGSLKSHMKSHDISKEIYKCLLCSKLCASASGLTRHKKTCILNSMCEYCGQMFLLPNQLN